MRPCRAQVAKRLFGLCCALAFAHTACASGWGRLSNIGAWLHPQSQRVPDVLSGYARYDEAAGTFTFVEAMAGGPRDDAPAHGSFSDPLRHRSNFGQLRVTTNPAFSDLVQMQAAGFVEGYLTAERIFDYAYNMRGWLAEQSNDTFKIGDWLFAQDRWAREQVQAHASSSSPSSSSPSAPPPAPSFWPAVGLLLAQLDGLLAGYSARLAAQGPGGGPLERLTKWDVLVLNALGDMDDLLGVVFPDDNTGDDTSDYSQDTAAFSSSSSSASSSSSRPSRTPNPERDASFFFRTPRSSSSGGSSSSSTGSEGAAAAEGGGETAAGAARPVPRRGPWSGLTPGQVRARIAKSGRCSALVKVTPDLGDLLLGHVTWWGYASMLRVYKHYELRLSGLAGAAGAPFNGRVSFSSYPGQLSSADDWYLLGSGLVVTETSLDVYDHSRYNASFGCSPASLLAWQRVGAANMLAGDGPGWAQLAAAYNSGTYNNQYMVVNLRLFTPGRELQPGLLTITEIIPGLVVTADATADLERGHWPSYNVPYFPEVYEATGYRRHAEALARRGPAFAEAAAGLSYQLAPRAKIFRRDAAGANDLASFRRLLRSNGWGVRPADPLSAASPWDALCGRGDLDPEDPDVYGCYDGKVTNYMRALELSADAINGPTTEDGQPPFRWDAHPRFRRVPRRGMLDVYDTEWEEQRP